MAKKKVIRDALIEAAQAQGLPTSSGTAAANTLRFKGVLTKAQQGKPLIQADLKFLERVRQTLDAANLWDLPQRPPRGG